MRAVIWIAVVTVAAVYALLAYLTLDRRSDREQLDSLFAHTAQSVQKRDLGGTISAVSKDYRDADGLNHDRLRMLTAQALQTDQEFTVNYTIDKTEITGDRATVDVSLRIDGTDTTVLYNRDLKVVLTREPGMHGIIIPTRYWRVTSIEGLGLSYELGL